MKADLKRRVERLIPLAKDGNDFISSSEIKKQLYERVNHDQQKKSFDKSIERILDELTDEGRVIRFKQGKTNCFYKTKKTKPSIESMESETATAFLLLEKYSKDLPEFIKSGVSPWFTEAQESFTNLESSEKKIFQNIKITTKFFPLVPDPIQPKVTEIIYSSLKEKRQIRFSYRKFRKPEEEYIVNPLGIDIRDNVGYLIAQKLAEKETKVFKMSRITRANLLDKKSVRPRDFNLDAFTKATVYSRRGTKKKISVEILLHRKWWHIINDYTVPDDWSEEEVPGQSDWKLVTFTSIDSSQLYEWLWGLEAGVIVKKPDFLSKQFQSDIKELLQRYETLL